METMRAASVNHRDHLQGNEAATRAVLIDPILRSLGWDIANPDLVLVEKTQTVHGQCLKVDYALLVDGDVRLVVEAKKLGGNLEDQFLQLVNYSFGLKVKSIFITDGTRWKHYLNLTPDNQEPVQVFDLSVHSPSEVAVYLIQHLDAALFVKESQVEVQLDELAEQLSASQTKMAAMDKRLAELERRLPPEDTPPRIEETGRVENGKAGKWHILSLQHEYTNRKPTELRLPNGEEPPVSKWKEVLVACCRFALTAHPALVNEIPLFDKAGRGTHLVQQVKPARSSAYAPVTIADKTLWVHTNYSAKVTVANCLYIINKVPATLRPQALSVVLREEAS